jgi:pimeloyl-ACP methyl ester carboxylesterase
MLTHLQDNLYGDVCLYPDVLVEFRRQLAVPGSAEAMYSTLRNTVLQDLTDEFRGLGGLRRPTLVIWGEEDRLVTLEGSRVVLMQAIPHLQLKPISRAAHLPQLERPHRFNDLVTKFLRDP